MSLPKYEFFGVPTWEESVRGLLQPLFEAPTLSDVPSQYVNATFEIIAAMILVILSHLLLIPIVRATLPRGKSFIELLDLYMHVIFLCLIVILSTLGTFLTSGSQEDRIRSYNVYTVTYLSLYIAKSIIHVPILFLSPNCTRKSFIQYMLHHMLSVVGYTVGLYTRRMHFYGCLNGLCEISALLLNIVLTWRFFEKERGVLYAVLGVFLWISYLVTRIFLFPIWLCLFYGEVFFGPYADTLSAMELYFFPLTTLLLFLLSIIWFAPITRGFFKAVRGAMGSDRKKEDERLSTSLPKSKLEKKKD